jgi:hypothetical protein
MSPAASMAITGGAIGCSVRVVARYASATRLPTPDSAYGTPLMSTEVSPMTFL